MEGEQGVAELKEGGWPVLAWAVPWADREVSCYWEAGGSSASALVSHSSQAWPWERESELGVGRGESAVQEVGGGADCLRQ